MFTIDPTVHDDPVQEGSGSDGDVEIVISEGPDPDAQADRSPEPDMADVVPEVRPSARTQAGFAALDLINVRHLHTTSLCDESPSSISQRSVPFNHEDSFVRDHQGDGVAQQHQSCQRLEIVRLTPEDALVQASQGRQGAQASSLGPVHQVRAGSVVGSLDPERGSTCDRHRDAKQEEKDRDGFR